MFFKDHMIMSFHGDQMDIIIVAILLLKKFYWNGTFLQNSKYDHWILHKKLVWGEMYTLFS